jgi:hypothetical protein
MECSRIIKDACTCLTEKLRKAPAEFVGPSVGPNREAVLNRINVVRVTADKVEQSWEKSRDGGAMWTMEFAESTRA